MAKSSQAPKVQEENNGSSSMQDLKMMIDPNEEIS